MHVYYVYYLTNIKIRYFGAKVLFYYFQQSLCLLCKEMPRLMLVLKL